MFTLSGNHAIRSVRSQSFTESPSVSCRMILRVNNNIRASTSSSSSSSSSSKTVKVNLRREGRFSLSLESNNLGRRMQPVLSKRVPTITTTRRRRSRQMMTAAAASAAFAAAANDGNQKKRKSFLNVLLDPPTKILATLWSRLAKPLQDFGFGRTRIIEGSVGLFIVGGVMLGMVIAGWIVGFFSSTRGQSYQAFIEFPVACGIQVGTNVRIRGVKAGTVLSVQPALDKVTVLVEMDDKKVPIPRNSIIDANQSGLIAETIIDITPKLPIPQAQWGPLDAGCEGEGVIVCDRGRIEGRPGVSMDDLVGICTRLAREMEAQDGVRKMFKVTDGAQDLMQVLEPLLTEAALIARELRPMMQGVKDQGTLETIELLAGHASATVQDIRELRKSILTEENQDMLRQSISTLTKTLQHVEKVSGDISSVSGDPSTRANLRHLIQSLSRLVDA
jgi:hypothetical protein